ncbi:serine hydrolase family protein [Streptomyces sp. TRM66268-LWL]|uniref:Serine hydrolase family protein n=1 Tax=Streptomyces polyasparticus TaxID=2767826 RepID=A0ABR7SV62_9ACTN|nr:alpha/beta fold hydrolase [Streptomyces polyasparticus]MBC9718689.1 serine hydrolase family protein [Streptomyces polyasparticus]
MVAYVIIPGIDGSDDQHWQSLWERESGPAAVRIAPASWSEPELTDWIAAVQRAYETARAQDADGEVVLVAHSLGCWAAAAWLAAAPAVRGALLVAPPDPQVPAFPREAAASFTGLTPQPLPCRAVVVGSSDDPYCTAETAEEYAAAWKARWHLAGAGGHLNSASGLGSWPEGRELLDSLTAG